MLQAADVLLYQATHVPVGEDQKQHVELIRDIALKFNTDYDVDLFTPPEPYIGGGTAARIMSLRDGNAKMSKSDPSDMSRINLTDSDDEIAQKIRKAKTDPEPLPDDPAIARRPARSEEPRHHLCRAHRRKREQVLVDFAGKGFRGVQAGARRPAGRPDRAVADPSFAIPRRSRGARSPAGGRIGARDGAWRHKRSPRPIGQSACRRNRSLHRRFSRDSALYLAPTSRIFDQSR